MLTPRWIIAFAGHIDLAIEPVIRGPLQNVLKELQARVDAKGGGLELYSSVAAGADVVCVEVARALKIPVHLILPLEQSEFAQTFPEGTWPRSAAQIAAVAADKGTIRVANAVRTAPGCYHDAGMQMLEAASLLVAVWDGQKGGATGGTSDIMQQAERVGLPVVWIDSNTGEIKPNQPYAQWPATDPIISELNGLAGESNPPCAFPLANVATLTTCLEDVARRQAASCRGAIIAIITLHLAAGFLATLSGVFKLLPLTTLEWLLISAALIVSGLLHRRHTQRKWMMARFARELVRSLQASVAVLDPLHPLISRQAPGWRRFAVSAGLLIRAQQPPVGSLAQLKDDYIRDRLEDQRRFFEGEGARARRRARWIRIAAEVCAWSAWAFVFLALLNKWREWHWERIPFGAIVVQFLPVALPLLAGAMTAIYYSLDVNRRRERYPQMAARLQTEKLWLEGLATPSAVTAAIAGCEEYLLNEVTEWEVVARASDVH
jgi:hypothetical protein